MALLNIKDLSIGFRVGGELNQVVHKVSLKIDRGEIVSLVGESGSGKSVTAMTVLQLLDSPPLEIINGEVLWQGEDLVKADERTLRRTRGNSISVIFQEPMTSLNPLHVIEKQIAEVVMLHKLCSAAEAATKALEWLNKVGIRDPEKKLKAFPHELSGGERQRVMIAMALANEPELLIADEPTTALDVTIQAQILDLITELQREMNMGVLFITHDLGIVRRISNRVAVMEKGQLVEEGTTDQIFNQPKHAYTQKLLAAEPSGKPPEIISDEPVLSIDDLKVWFPIKRGILKRTVGHVKAVNGVSLSLKTGETIGVVGESGSGKSTLAKAILKLETSEGAIEFQGQDLQQMDRKSMRPYRKAMQIVFQDPYGSLSPRMSVGEIIGEGLEIHNIGDEHQREEMVIKAMQDVELDPEF